jgi:hypothetical protein
MGRKIVRPIPWGTGAWTGVVGRRLKGPPEVAGGGARICLRSQSPASFPLAIRFFVQFIDKA